MPALCKALLREWMQLRVRLDPCPKWAYNRDKDRNINNSIIRENVVCAIREAITICSGGAEERDFTYIIETACDT